MSLCFLFIILSFLSGNFGEPSRMKVDEYVEAIKKFREESAHWVPPTDFSQYLEGYDESAECIEEDTYDFIIIGGGSAGTVLANRLSEILNWKILLLEVGGTENKVADIPGMATELTTSYLNMGLYSTPMKGFAAYFNNSIPIPRAAVLGGCSVTSYMFYSRGNREDFNTWAAMGNPGWSYDEVLPYFIKSEHATFSDANPKYHGKNGTLNVEHGRYFTEIGQAYLDGLQELGRKYLPDYNAEEQLGCSKLQTTEINGTRDSGARAFIHPIKHRTNLHISLKSFVLKILIDPKIKIAYGVKYFRNGTCYNATVRKEVILSAGALNSPRILLLSGVGPAWHLKEFNITVLKDLTVGENLWSHVVYPNFVYSVNYTFENISLENQISDNLEGKGYMSVGVGLQAVNYMNMRNDNGTVPDIEHLLLISLPSDSPRHVISTRLGFTDEAYMSIYGPQFPDDVEVLLSGVRHAEKIMNTPAMLKFNPELLNVTVPICEEFQHGSDNFWRCMIRNAAYTAQHFGGTCKMGPDDHTAVVDTRLRVYGIKNLRVADNSVMPNTLSGHTLALAFMIAEKAADMIKEDHLKECSEEVST